MSRKRIRKLLSAAMGLLALGSGTSNAFGEGEGTSTSSASSEDYPVTRSQTEINEDENNDYDNDYDSTTVGSRERTTSPAGGSDFDPTRDFGQEEDDSPSGELYRNFDSDDFDPEAIRHARNQMAAIKNKVSNANSRFMTLSSNWTNSLNALGGAALQTTSNQISTFIKDINTLKEKFDRKHSDFSREIASNPSSPELFNIVDDASELANNFDLAVKQLEDNIASFEQDALDVKANDKVVDQQKRRINANLLFNERNSVSQYLVAVTHFMDRTKFTDIKNYKGQVRNLSIELADIRKTLDSKGEDGVSNDEYSSIMARLNEISGLLRTIEKNVDAAAKVYNKDTNHGLLTKTLLQLNSMWRGFSSECNPKKVSASGMSSDSVEQCNVFYNTVKENYLKHRKEIRNKIKAALSDMDSYDPSIEKLCQDKLMEFNASIVASTRSFHSVQEFEAGRHKQMSPSEYRQKTRAEFVDECRAIRDRDELTKSEKIDELVRAMNKVLPGRESFHRQMLNVLSRDVQIDAAGSVDVTSLLAKNILLIGAPGNGKTEEARAAADALGLKIIYANGDNFATESSSQRFFNDLANETANANSRFVIFFDEIDSIFTNRRIATGNQEGAVTVFNTFITDTLMKYPELMKRFAGILGTTNLAPSELDPALLSRFQQQIRVPRFDETDARHFLRVELDPVSITANTTKEALIGKLASIMVDKHIDARKALNIIDEVWSHAKSNMDTAPLPDETTAGGEFFEDDASNDVIITPDSLISAFNGMKIEEKRTKVKNNNWDSERRSRWDRDDNIGNTDTRPSTPVK